MIVETERENLCVNKLISEKKETIYVDGDMIVPDAKPDILNTICTSGVISVYKKETLEGKVRIDGNINTYIMYLSENSEDKIRGLNPVLEFSENINIPNCTENTNLQMNSTIKTIECKVINGRKISLKATVELDLKIYSNEETEVVNNILNDENIKILKKDLKVNSLIGMEENKLFAKDNISIDSNDNLAEILKANINICDSDIKISYNKVLTKSEAEVKIMYLTEDGKVNTVTSKIPVVGFVDIPNVTEKNICDINYQIKNLILKPNSVEEHSIYIELEIGVTCMVYEEKNINLIQDLYSPCENINFDKKQINTITNKCNRKETKQVREKINIENVENKKIIDVDVNTIINKENKMNSSIMYDGEIEMNFILLNKETMEIDTKKVNLPFEYTLDNLNNLDNINVNTIVVLQNHDFIVQESGNIICNLDLLINSDLYTNTLINIIDNIENNGEREEEDYSIIMYIVKKDDTLWKIAKKFGTTVENIAIVNGIEDESQISINQKLYIPRYMRVNTKKETPLNVYAQ